MNHKKMECYVCRLEQGRLIASSCGCSSVWYHDECVKPLSGNDVYRCPACQRVDMNRPSLRYWSLDVLVDACESLAYRTSSVLKYHTFTYVVTALYAYALRVFHPELVRLLLPWCVFLLFRFAYRFFEKNIVLTRTQMVPFYVLVVLLYAFVGDDSVLRLHLMGVVSVAYLCWFVVNHFVTVYSLRREHFDSGFFVRDSTWLVQLVRNLIATVLFYMVVYVCSYENQELVDFFTKN